MSRPTRTLSLVLVAATVTLSTARLGHAQSAADDFREVARRPAPAPVSAPADANGANGTNGASTTAPPDKPKGPWELSFFGYLRGGYDHTMKDSRYAFVGNNNGLVLDSARVGLDGRNTQYDIFWRVSIEGASDVMASPNTPIGSLSVRLRDAFARWDPLTYIGVQVGQFKAPFQEEELRSTTDLLFASRAVGVDGVQAGRGIEVPGIALDRQLGVMLSPARPIGGAVGVSYYLMVMNGNGSNQVLDDNGRFGLVARSELSYQRYVRAGVALFRNDRTVGTPPNLYNEEDLGLTGDLTVNVANFQLFGAVTRVRTVFPTVGASARVQLAYHAQAGYRIDIPHGFIMPAYRIAYFHPWQSGGDSNFDSFRLQYHTVGVRAGHDLIPIQAWLNYTLTTEADGRKLDNDRIELVGQVTF